MRTTCPTCNAPVRARQWIATADSLFVEVYDCGAVKAWGRVEPERQVVRSCPREPSRIPEPSVAFASDPR